MLPCLHYACMHCRALHYTHCILRIATLFKTHGLPKDVACSTRVEPRIICTCVLCVSFIFPLSIFFLNYGQFCSLATFYSLPLWGCKGFTFYLLPLWGCKGPQGASWSWPDPRSLSSSELSNTYLWLSKKRTIWTTSYLDFVDFSSQKVVKPLTEWDQWM